MLIKSTCSKTYKAFCQNIEKWRHEYEFSRVLFQVDIMSKLGNTWCVCLLNQEPRDREQLKWVQVELSLSSAYSVDSCLILYPKLKPNRK